MSKIIDANKLIMKDLGNGTYLITEEAILNARSFEAEPVRHGQWIDRDYYGEHNGTSIFSCKCSVCGSWLKDADDYNYCPECGAKMDGKKAIEVSE